MFFQQKKLKLIKWLEYTVYTEGVCFFAKFNLANPFIKKITHLLNL